MAEALTKTGRYQIVGEIGRGSMGVVYQGFDPVIGRTVAIKTMLPEGLSPQEFQEYKARFQREAMAAGTLAHPNIITVYDFGADSGVLYLAMEYLEGKSLEKIVQEQTVLPIETILPIYDQVCGALDHAHWNKIVHRDVKPANIVILHNGLVKVTDFGIAKMLAMGMTQAGQILGTPNYMSPEQVKGRQIDGRSDIFSLGVILYELVTGQKPFGGQNITTVIYKIINENPIPPHELDASIPAGLSCVISKALAKNVEERYQTCRELAEDLRNYRNPGGGVVSQSTVILKSTPIPAAFECSRRTPCHLQRLPSAHFVDEHFWQTMFASSDEPRIEPAPSAPGASSPTSTKDSVRAEEIISNHPFNRTPWDHPLEDILKRDPNIMTGDQPPHVIQPPQNFPCASSAMPQHPPLDANDERLFEAMFASSYKPLNRSASSPLPSSRPPVNPTRKPDTIDELIAKMFHPAEIEFRNFFGAVGAPRPSILPEPVPLEVINSPVHKGEGIQEAVTCASLSTNACLPSVPGEDDDPLKLPSCPPLYCAPPPPPTPFEELTTETTDLVEPKIKSRLQKLPPLPIGAGFLFLAVCAVFGGRHLAQLALMQAPTPRADHSASLSSQHAGHGSINEPPVLVKEAQTSTGQPQLTTPGGAIGTPLTSALQGQNSVRGARRGSLLLVVGENGAAALLDGKKYSRLTRHGQIVISDLRPGPHTVSVSKDGFQNSGLRVVHILDGQQTRLYYELRPNPPMASLTIVGAMPGTGVLIDEKEVGAIHEDGTLFVSNINPGIRNIEFKRRNLKPRSSRESSYRTRLSN